MVLLTACGGAQRAGSVLSPQEGFDPYAFLPQGSRGVVDMDPRSLLTGPYRRYLDPFIEQALSENPPDAELVLDMLTHIDRLVLPVTAEGTVDANVRLVHSELSPEEALVLLQAGGGEVTLGTVAGHVALLGGETPPVRVHPSGWWLLAPEGRGAFLIANARRPPAMAEPRWAELEQRLVPGMEWQGIYVPLRGSVGEDPIFKGATGTAFSASMMDGIRGRMIIGFENAVDAETAVALGRTRVADLAESTLARAFGLESVREAFRFSVDGTIGVGHLEMADPELSALLDRLQALVQLGLEQRRREQAAAMQAAEAEATDESPPGDSAGPTEPSQDEAAQ